MSLVILMQLRVCLLLVQKQCDEAKALSTLGILNQRLPLAIPPSSFPLQHFLGSAIPWSVLKSAKKLSFS